MSTGEKRTLADYDDIINLPHFHAPTHPYMKNADRTAQFAPYKSLNGYYDLIDEAKGEVDNTVWEDLETISDDFD